MNDKEFWVYCLVLVLSATIFTYAALFLLDKLGVFDVDEEDQP